MAHDFAAQKAETLAIYQDLSAQQDLPDFADIDYVLVPEAPAADWKPLAEALADNGFETEYVTPDEDGGSPYVVATLTDQIISADSIWIGEEVATRIALPYGFVPDGWGFFS